MVAEPQERASMALSDLARRLEDAQRKRRHDRHTRPWRPVMTPVTSLGYECERRSVYHRVYPEKAQSVDVELASIFEEGDLHQKDVRAELLALGFEVVEAEVNFRDETLEISGTIDGKIQLPSEDGRRPRRIPVEIKSTAGRPPTSEAEWREAETPLLRRYYAQLEVYLYLTNEPEGLGIFKEKNTGLWSVVPVALNYGYVEGVLQRAARIRDAVRAVKADGDEHLPPRQLDRSECGGCPFRDTLCHPAEAPVDPVLLADDAELLAQIVEREQTEEPSKRFKKLDEAIKERLKLTKFERFVIGGPSGFVVTKKVYPTQTRIKIERLTQ